MTITLDTLKDRTEKQLLHFLPQAPSAHSTLSSAMRYSVLNGGKRLRPLLVYATASDLHISLETVDVIACAVEFIHCYSLIHDDLPAMDDDHLRRGKPTCHIAFNEGIAILAGDALQSLALEILTTQSHLTHAQVTEIMRTLTHACSLMVEGQAIDITVAHQAISLETLEHLHRLKTGALISACIMLVTLVSKNIDAKTKTKLERFSEYIGLAFQIQDDIIDVESSTDILGKSQGSDLRLHKTTYPELLGLANAKEKALNLLTLATEALQNTPFAFPLLKELARRMVKRNC